MLLVFSNYIAQQKHKTVQMDKLFVAKKLTIKEFSNFLYYFCNSLKGLLKLAFLWILVKN